MDVRMIAVERLVGHRLNSNVMSREKFGKLKRAIGETGRYPPVVVRRKAEGRERGRVGNGGGAKPQAAGEWFEILDGHHRVKALRELGIGEAMCVVWEVGEEEALVLLSTLNRLEGADDPVKRAALLAELRERYGKTTKELGKVLPDGRKGVERLLRLREPVRLRSAAEVAAGLPECVSFFLSKGEKVELEEALKRVGGTREAGLMMLVRGWGAEI